MSQAFRIVRRSLLVLAVVCIGLYVFTRYVCTTYSANGLAIWSIDDGALFIHEGPGRATCGSQTTISFPRGGYPCPSQFEFGKRTQWKMKPFMWSTIYPLWPLVAAVVVPAVICYRREIRRPSMLIRSRQRIARGHCPHCDYDLRANTSGTCPECGRAMPEELKRRLES